MITKDGRIIQEVPTPLSNFSKSSSKVTPIINNQYDYKKVANSKPEEEKPPDEEEEPEVVIRKELPNDIYVSSRFPLTNKNIKASE